MVDCLLPFSQGQASLICSLMIPKCLEQCLRGIHSILVELHWTVIIPWPRSALGAMGVYGNGPHWAGQERSCEGADASAELVSQETDWGGRRNHEKQWSHGCEVPPWVLFQGEIQIGYYLWLLFRARKSNPIGNKLCKQMFQQSLILSGCTPLLSWALITFHRQTALARNSSLTSLNLCFGH